MTFGASVRALLTAATVLGLAGCVPQFLRTGSIEPLYANVEAAEVTFDERLVGEWMSVGTHVIYRFEFRKVEKSRAGQASNPVVGPAASAVPQYEPRYAVTVTALDGTVRSSVLTGVLVRLGDGHYLDLSSAQVTSLSREWIDNVVPTHLILRVGVHDDRLELSFLDGEWVREQLRPGQLVADASQRETSLSPELVINVPTPELQSLVFKAAQGAVGFGDSISLTRSGTVAFYEGLIAEGHAGMGALHFDEGEYQKAADAWTQVAQFRPQDTDSRFNLYMALLGAGNGARAREEVAALSRICPASSAPPRSSFLSVCEIFTGNLESPASRFDLLLVAFSYMIDGAYGEGARQFRAYFSSKTEAVERSDAQDVLFYYIALRLAGQSEEARGVMARFEPLLANGEGRCRACEYLRGAIDEGVYLDPASGTPTTEQASLIAHRALIDGNIPKARVWFERVVDRGDYEDVACMLAYARLREFGP